MRRRDGSVAGPTRRARRPRAVLAIAAATLASSAVAATPPPPRREPIDTVVVQPRPFGHAIGDVLTQRVLLASHGQAVQPAGVPLPARVGAWFERRAARVETDAAGRRWLVVDYQVVTAPTALATIRVPAWQVDLAGGGTPLHVPAAPVTLTPLVLRATPGTPAWSLRPDRGAPAPDVAALQRRLVLEGAALAAVGLAWIAWALWREARDAATRPFARAWRELRPLPDGSEAAHAVLHRAFDRAAGEATRVATLPRLFSRVPSLAPQRAPIERFYAQSAARFFGTPAPAEPVSTHALGRALRRLERRSAR
jgi:mxaA protein